MVLPQAMAWVQYWFRVLSLKFCGKFKKNCGDISPQSPAFCMYASSCRWLDWKDGLNQNTQNSQNHILKFKKLSLGTCLKYFHRTHLMTASPLCTSELFINVYSSPPPLWHNRTMGITAFTDAIDGMTNQMSMQWQYDHQKIWQCHCMICIFL